MWWEHKNISFVPSYTLVPACTFVSKPPGETSLPDINPMFVTRYGVCVEGGSFSPSFGVCIPNDQGK